MTGSTLVLVETSAQAEWAAAQSALQPELKLIALSPAAAYALERRGIAFGTDDDVRDETCVRRMGKRNFRVLDQFCAFADEYLGRRSAVLYEANLKPVSFHYFYLKTLFDGVTLRLDLMQKMIAAEKPQEVWFFATRQSAIPSTLFFEGSIFARIVPFLCQRLGVPTRALPETTTQPQRRRYLSVHKAWRLLRHNPRGVAGMVSHFLRGERPGAIATLDSSLLLELSRLGRSGALYRDPAGLSQDQRTRQFADEMPDLWSRLWAKREFQRYLTWRGLDYSRLVKGRLEHYFLHLLPDALRIYLEARAAFDRLKPTTLLALHYSDYPRRAIAQAARSLGIPVTVVQHGAYGSFEWPIVYNTDLVASDYALLWGEGVEHHLAKQFANTPALLPVGSLKLDSLVRARHRLKRTVLYCLTNLMGNAQYLAGHTRSDHRCFAVQKAIVRVFQDFPDIRFLIKLHPNPDLPASPITQFIKDKGIANCTVVESTPLADLLGAADLFVIDYPATALLETLTTGKPVLVFNDFFRWEEGALELLKKSTLFSDNLEDFVHILRKALDRPHDISLPAGEDGFLKRFGTYRGDGKSAERFLLALDLIGAERDRSPAAAVARDIQRVPEI